MITHEKALLLLHSKASDDFHYREPLIVYQYANSCMKVLE